VLSVPRRPWYLDARFSEVIADGGLRMPFVIITIYEGHGTYVAGKPGSK
jgi:hypothetical protein